MGIEISPFVWALVDGCTAVRSYRVTSPRLSIREPAGLVYRASAPRPMTHFPFLGQILFLTGFSWRNDW